MPRLNRLVWMLAQALVACASSQPPPLEPPTLRLVADATDIRTETALRLSADELIAKRGIKRVAFFDGATRIAEFGPDAAYTHEIQVTAALNGLREYTARVTDTTDITATSSPVRVTVNIREPDTQTPVVTLIPSTSTVNEAGWVRLSANVTDNRAVTGVDFLVGDELYATDRVAPFEYDLALGTGDNGSLNVRGVARDAAGNSGSSAEVTLGVAIPVTPDTEPPELRLTGNTDYVTAGTPLTLMATATDNVGVTRVAFFKDGVFIAEVTSAPYTLNVPLSKADNGPHSITAFAFDAGGNKRGALFTVFVSL
jgi:Bacterial Ig domain